MKRIPSADDPDLDAVLRVPTSKTVKDKERLTRVEEVNRSLTIHLHEHAHV